jgi:hypothetical protein
MQVSYASVPAPGAVNEDVVVGGGDHVAVLDGATAMPGVATGCRHDVAWFVGRLGGQLGVRLAVSDASLHTLLAEAIGATMAMHASSCDLSNPDSPSATVSILRRRGDALDYLVLADSPILLDNGAVQAITDDRIDRLPDYSIAGVSRLRNTEAGFWVASTVPAAAERAVTGSVPVASVRRAAIFSDGASRLVERFDELSWSQLLDLLERAGPLGLIARTRAVEAGATAVRRGKRYDDATAVLLTV